jgi:hypothetical protein
MAYSPKLNKVYKRYPLVLGQFIANSTKLNYMSSVLAFYRVSQEKKKMLRQRDTVDAAAVFRELSVHAGMRDVNGEK